MVPYLTPFDAETLAMIESLTERDAIETRHDVNFTVLAFYDKHNEPEYINALIDAVRGRMGERFIEVKDDTERKMLVFTIEYDLQDLPFVDGFTDSCKPKLEFGKTYLCANPVDPNTETVAKAIQVRRNNHISVAEFCGNGTINIERKINGKAWFTFLNNGTYVDVPEFDYIVRRKESNSFEIWEKNKFESVWMQYQF